MTPPPALPLSAQNVSSAVATCLCEQREQITGRWIEAVRQDHEVGSANALTDEDLADHLPKLFDDLAGTLRGEPLTEQADRDAEAHGEHRWQQHYSLEEVLKELGIVRRMVLEHGLNGFEQAHLDLSREWMYPVREQILQFFDDTAAGSIRQYALKQREQLASLHKQVRAADRAAAAAVQSDLDRLADVFNRSPSFMALLRGPEHVFEMANDRYYQLVGHRELLHQPVRQALPELAGQVFFDLLDGVYSTGEPFIGKDVPIKLQVEAGLPPEEHFVDFVYLPTRDSDGTINGIFVHGVDWTERKHLMVQNEQLLDSERAARSEAERVSHVKDEFLATLSHELRTPLNAILGWTQVLRGDPANTEDMEAGLTTIERNARAQTQIIEDLLDMSRIISGKVRLDVQRLDLEQVVAAAVETMHPAADAKGIHLQALIDPQARMISGDPNRLQQVFWNLLSNAIKFTPKGGRVQVLLERIHSHLEVSVADSGEGIAPEFLPQVFDRFRQADASTTRRHGGLGLGLAIVKQLVELHGGSVHVDSAGLGHGTTFRVMLPLSVVQPALDPADPARQHPQRGGASMSIPAELLKLAGVRVLVVDDEADARELVRRLLEDREAVVQTAGTAAAAMELIRTQRPDVLISDIGMPGEDGYSLIRQVRALTTEQGGSIPAVALTAYARSEDRLKVILAGFQLHMAKPVEAAELLAQVASLAGRVPSH